MVLRAEADLKPPLAFQKAVPTADIIDQRYMVAVSQAGQ